MAKTNGKRVPTGGGDSIDLLMDTVVVGRRPSCDIMMEFSNISGQHCRFSFREGYWYVEDLQSTNGTKVNGTRVLTKVIYPGEIVTIGKRPFRLMYELPQGSPLVPETSVEDLSIPLLRKAGLDKGPTNYSRASKDIVFDPADFLLQGDID